MDGADSRTLIRHTRAERERLAGVLSALTPEQWNAESLCARWRVRDVAAHLTMPYRMKRSAVLLGLIRAGLNFNRFAEGEARQAADTMGGDELAALLHRNATNPWNPPGGGPADALGHDVIHGLDITEALGLPAAPVERVALVLAGTTSRQVKYFGVDLKGVRLRAADTDISVGDGPREDWMPAKEVLLTITGRREVHPIGRTD